MQRTSWEAHTRHQEPGLVALQLAIKEHAPPYQCFAPSIHSFPQLFMGDLSSPCTPTLCSTMPGSTLAVTHTSHPPQLLNMKDIWKRVALTRVLIKKTSVEARKAFPSHS